MERPNIFIVLVFLVFVLALSGVVFGQRVIDLDKVWGDMRMLGILDGDKFGIRTAHGDINGDGYQDILVSTYFATVEGRDRAGAAYVFLGSSSPDLTIDLSTQSADLTICGAVDIDLLGRSVASGDVNGDGYDDIIIGAHGADPGGRSEAGKTYVIFGGSLLPELIDLKLLPANVTVYGNNADDHCGWAAASGNVNGDAYDDIIIGAYWADPGDPPREKAGETYVIFGSNSLPSTIDLHSTTANITIYGDNAYDYFGSSLSSGDINGDALDDLIIGAYWANRDALNDVGKTYVIFSSAPSPSTIDLSVEPASITVHGAGSLNYCGRAVASGDVNADNYDDVLFSCCYGVGETHVILGKSFPTPPYTIDLKTQSTDITIYGVIAYENSGVALASGDVNADGYHDILIGAFSADLPVGTSAGKAYCLFGGDFSSPPYTIYFSSQPADITFLGDDAGDLLGYAVASGDVNADGYDDIIIGAFTADPDGRIDAGEAYLALGGGSFITSHGLGGKSWINSFSLLGRCWGSFKAFKDANSQGEVHLAVGDLDTDSMDEIAAGHGEGGKSWVKLFEVNGTLISTFKAFGGANTNGELHLAIGNFVANLSDNEIAVAQGEGGQSWVKVFETDGTFIRSIKAFGGANAQGEVHLAAGDLENADGISEIIAGMGEGGSSRVKIFSHEGTLIRSFKAFGGANGGGEVHVAVGNFDADADLEIAAATGYNGNNLVKLFEKDGTFISQFAVFMFGSNLNGDVQIAAGDVDNDGIWEIICGHGEGGNSIVHVCKIDGTVVRSFKAFGAANAQGEVHLGRSNY